MRMVQDDRPSVHRDATETQPDHPEHHGDCPRCGGTTEARLEPEGSIHYARVVCRRCRSFIRWLPKPLSDREAEAARLFAGLIAARRRNDHKAIGGLQSALRKLGWTVLATCPKGGGE